MQVSLPLPLLSLGQLSRAADVPPVRVSKLIKTGSFMPDFKSGNAFLFLPERLRELQARLHPEHTETAPF